MSALTLHDSVDLFEAAVFAISTAAAASPNQFFELTLAGPKLRSLEERDDFARRLKESAIVGACIYRVEWTTPTQLIATVNTGLDYSECATLASHVISRELRKGGWNEFDAAGHLNAPVRYADGTYQGGDGCGFGRRDGKELGNALLVTMQVASVGQSKARVLEKAAKMLHCSTNGVLLVIVFNLETERQVDPPSHLFTVEARLKGDGPHINSKCPSSVLAPWEKSSFTYQTPAPLVGLEIDIPGHYFGFEEDELEYVHLDLTPVVKRTVAMMASELEKQLEWEAADAARPGRNEHAADPELSLAALQLNERQDYDCRLSPSSAASS